MRYVLKVSTLICYRGDHMAGCTKESRSLRDVVGETATGIAEKITPKLHDPQTKSLTNYHDNKITASFLL